MYNIIESYMVGNSIIAYSLIDCENNTIVRLSRGDVINLTLNGMVSNARARRIADGSIQLVGVNCYLCDLDTWKLVSDNAKFSGLGRTDNSNIHRLTKIRQEKKFNNIDRLVEDLKDKVGNDYREISLCIITAESIKCNEAPRILIKVSAFGGVELLFKLALSEKWQDNGSFVIQSDSNQKKVKYNSYKSLLDKITTFIAYECFNYGLAFEDNRDIITGYYKMVRQLGYKMSTWS